MKTVILDRDQGVLAWHFVHNSGHMARYDHGLVDYDGPLAQVGDVQEVAGEIVPCTNGLHGSERPIDALQYAPGGILQRTRHYGTVAYHADGDKLASSHRETLALLPSATVLPVLVGWTCWCVQDCWAVLRQGGIAPDPRSVAAIDTMIAFQAGKATREELDAAAADAATAADAAYAAYAAATTATTTADAAYAAYAAAYAAYAAAAATDARAAAAAAIDAARADDDAAARERQNAELQRRLMALLPAGML